ncbi:non-ribosomal peptide synthetase [Kibdelosporangium persicum]|uniref:Non-ribosomal peptide synthetase n=1 Tax=Kibdelosporangium persicum TaxID=2698649 RepID=A0ABX2FIZ9_9PSEU|nr:non-ribosomal peptide synthetase [Kibdelosporangium persicum]NRN70680.1 Non-ribosomal peptide synthetase [Kibdelosporangium persicum]
MPTEPFDQPRVAALSDRKRRLLSLLLADRGKQVDNGALERLRPGTGDPIVLIHPVGGQVLCYVDLVKQLPGDAPCVAVTADRLLSGAEAPTVPDLATHYLGLLDAAGLRPGVLAGWSMGGVLAYEMARQVAKTVEPPPVVLIDSTTKPAIYAGQSRTDAQFVEFFVHDLIRSAGRDPAEFDFDAEIWQRSATVALTVAEAQMAARGFTLGLTPADLEDRYRTYRNATLALDDYQPGTYDHPVHLIRATVWHGPDSAKAWRQVVTGELTVTELPIDHYGLLRPPFVLDVARILHSATVAKDDAVEVAGPVGTSERQRPLVVESPVATANSTIVLRVSGSLDVERLGKATAAAMDRHPALRGGELDVIRPTTADDDQSAAIQAFLRQPIDEHGPLARCALFATGQDQWLLAIATHPSVLDGHSARILCADLQSGYAEGVLEPAPAPVPPDQTTHSRYWEERLADLPAAGTWPQDQIAEAEAGGDPAPRSGGVHRFEISAEVATALRRHASAFSTTPLAVLATAVRVLLARVSPEAGEVCDTAVGAVVSGRVGADAHRVVGNVTRTVVLAQRIDPEASFATLTRRAAAQQVTDLEHAVGSAAALEADLGRSPLFRVLVRLDDEQTTAPRLGDADTEIVEMTTGWPGTDLAITLTAVGAGYQGTIEYATDLYGPDTAARITTALSALLADAVARPHECVGDLDIGPTEAETGRIAEPAEVHADTTFAHELFENTARRRPDDVAMSWPGGRLTYREVQQAAAALAPRLAGARLVALHCRRSPHLVVAMLAALRQGAGYVPLDVTYPVDRLNFMLSDSGANVLIQDTDLSGRLTVPAGCRVISLDGVPQGTPESADTPAVSPQDLVYVIYTSGSTGRPKGVAMPHKPVATMLGWQARRSAAGPGWNTLQFSPASFDASFQEVFSTWATGGTIVLVDEQTRRDPRQLLDYLDAHRIHRLFVPFVALRMLAETAVRLGRYPAQLREVITSGEQLRVTPAIREFFTRTGASLENQYGPTEAHPASAELLDPDPAGWPALPSIGFARDGAAIDVVDARLRPLPVGVPGQICVSGCGLAQGYLGRRELTAERFPELATGRVYLTGDVGRKRPDGRMDFIGRTDDQVKIRGYRVEFGEVEAQICGEARIADAAVVLQDGPEANGHGPRLIAYCVPANDARLSAGELRDRLARTLPEYMIPARFLFVDRFPLTPSGKVDRKALARTVPAQDAQPAESTERELTETERKISDIWRELLDVHHPPTEVSMFDLGGNSLVVTGLAARVEELFGIVIPVAEFFTHNTVTAQAALVDRLFDDEIGEYSADEVSAALNRLSAG